MLKLIKHAYDDFRIELDEKEIAIFVGLNAESNAQCGMDSASKFYNSPILTYRPFHATITESSTFWEKRAYLQLTGETNENAY